MSIDTLDASSSSVAYSPFRTEGNRTSYIGTQHSDLTKDQVVVTSNPPKRTVGSYGNRRSSVNLVRSVSVATPSGGTEVKDLKVELVFSIPVGTLSTDFDEALARTSNIASATLSSIAVTGITQF